MQQLKCFTVQAGPTFAAGKQEIGEVICDTVNPFLASHEGTDIESVNIEMAGSFHKAVVIVSYEAEARPRIGRPPKSDKEIEK